MTAAGFYWVNKDQQSRSFSQSTDDESRAIRRHIRTRRNQGSFVNLQAPTGELLRIRGSNESDRGARPRATFELRLLNCKPPEKKADSHSRPRQKRELLRSPEEDNRSCRLETADSAEQKVSEAVERRHAGWRKDECSGSVWGGYISGDQDCGLVDTGRLERWLSIYPVPCDEGVHSAVEFCKLILNPA